MEAKPDGRPAAAGHEKTPVDDIYAMKIGAIWSALKEQKASFWFICFYLLFEYVRPQSIYPSMDFLPYAQIFLILSLVFSMIEGTLFSVKSPSTKWVMVFLGVVLVSSVFAYSPQASFDHLKVIVTWVIVYFLIINIVNSEKRFIIFFLSFLLYSFKMSQHGFLTWAERGFAFANWGVTGAPGWFQNSGEFGIQLCVFLPLSLCFIIALKDRWGWVAKVFFYLMPFTAVGSVLATSSRGAILGSIAACAWLVVNSRYRAKALVLAVLVGVLAYQFMPPQFAERFHTAGEDKTSMERLVRWERGIEIANENPVIGIGYGNWLTYIRDHYRTNLGLSHNIFIDAGAEMGYSGLFALLAIIATTLFTNRRTRRLAMEIDDKFCTTMAIGFDSALMGYLVSASFVSVLYYPYLWINLALVVALHTTASQRRAAVRRDAVEEPIRLTGLGRRGYKHRSWQPRA